MSEGSNSILDKIIESKEIGEIEKFRPQDVVETLLKYANHRERDILRRRFGLSGNPKETLETVGEVYKITRERVRQVENLTIKKLVKLSQFADLTKAIFETIAHTLKKNGGVMRQDLLLEELLKLSGNTEEAQNAVLFVMEKLYSKQFVLIKETAQLHISWRLHSTQLPIIESAIEALITYFKKKNVPQTPGQILEDLAHETYFIEHPYQLEEDHILSFMDVSQHIDKNPYGEYGLRAWPQISPKRMNDKILLIMRKHGKPLHFNEITEMINKLKFDNRKAYAPTVHNELILNKEYVLVGRGIYALREWGYQPGVVVDVITQILQSHNEPMTRKEIVTEVLAKRMVKKNTIHLALTNKKRFTKMPDGRYTIQQQIGQ